FPKLDGYRVELPDEAVTLDTESAPRFEIGPSTVPRHVELQGVVGETEYERGGSRVYRRQEVAYALARRILDAHFNTDEDRRPWMFPQLVQVSNQWLDSCLSIAE